MFHRKRTTADVCCCNMYVCMLACTHVCMYVYVCEQACSSGWKPQSMQSGEPLMREAHNRFGRESAQPLIK